MTMTRPARGHVIPIFHAIQKINPVNLSLVKFSLGVNVGQKGQIERIGSMP